MTVAGFGSLLSGVQGNNRHTYVCSVGQALAQLLVTSNCGSCCTSSAVNCCLVIYKRLTRFSWLIMFPCQSAAHA